MRAAIIVDSTAALSQELRQHPDVYQLDLTIHFSDGNQLKDTTDLQKNQAFYQKLRECDELPTTSQPFVGNYYDLMDELVEKRYDTVYAIHLSSGISGTYQSAQVVAQEYSTYIKTYVIDTKSASVVMHELVIQALTMISDEKPLSREKIYEKLTWIVNHAYVEFMVQDLMNLTKGGRLSSTGAIVGSMLQIRPILTFNEKGELEVIHKIRTTKKVMRHFQEIALEAEKNYPQGFSLAIAHTNALQNAMALKTMIEDALEGRVTCRIDVLTPVLGTHTGEGLFGIGIIPHYPE